MRTVVTPYYNVGALNDERAMNTTGEIDRSSFYLNRDRRTGSGDMALWMPRTVRIRAVTLGLILCTMGRGMDLLYINC